MVIAKHPDQPLGLMHQSIGFGRNSHSLQPSLEGKRRLQNEGIAINRDGLGQGRDGQRKAHQVGGIVGIHWFMGRGRESLAWAG